jgi:hypothetical protein
MRRLKPLLQVNKVVSNTTSQETECKKKIVQNEHFTQNSTISSQQNFDSSSCWKCPVDDLVTNPMNLSQKTDELTARSNNFLSSNSELTLVDNSDHLEDIPKSQNEVISNKEKKNINSNFDKSNNLIDGITYNIAKRPVSSIWNEPEYKFVC